MVSLNLSPIHRLILAMVLARLCNAQYHARLGSRDGGSQESKSRSLYLVSHDNFCLFGPPDPFEYIWNTAKNVVSWCSKSGHGTRLIPDGTLHGVTYVKAKDWVQVSGTGDFTKVNIAPNDGGGQFDSSRNTPAGAEMFVSDDNQRASSWVTLISANTFCVRACTGDARFCPTEYDQMGCWFLTGNAVGNAGEWKDCESDNGDPPSPSSPSAPPLRGCQAGATVGNGQPPPPLYSWDGEGKAAPIGGPTASPTTSSGDHTGDAAGGSSGPSTSWVEVSTCTPCPTDTASASASASNSASGSTAAGGEGTIQQGVTQLSKAEGGASTTAPPARLGGGDLLDRRDEVETTTKDGQCCWSTWTPSIVGGSTSSANGSSTRTGSATASKSLTLGGNVTASSSGSRASTAVSGSASTSGNVTGGNGTGGNETSGAMRLYVLKGAGAGRLLLGVVVTGLAMGLGSYGLL